MIVDLKQDQDLNGLLANNNKVIIDIYATWCGPCKMLAPQLESFAQKREDWTIIRVDSDARSDVAAMFNVQAVPTMVIIREKHVMETVVGFKPLIEIERITSKY